MDAVTTTSHATGPVRPARRRRNSHDVWLQWAETYQPACPNCSQAMIGLIDQGSYVQRDLRIITIAEPCGCDVSAHTLAIQAAAVQAGALDLTA